jgi:hypothetical protein
MSRSTTSTSATQSRVSAVCKSSDSPFDESGKAENRGAGKTGETETWSLVGQTNAYIEWKSYVAAQTAGRRMDGSVSHGAQSVISIHNK